jgi:hypothetical protein
MDNLVEHTDISVEHAARERGGGCWGTTTEGEGEMDGGRCVICV